MQGGGERVVMMAKHRFLLQIAAKKRVFENYYKDVIACELFEKKAVCKNGDYDGDNPELEEAVYRYTKDNGAFIKVRFIAE